MEAVFHLKPAAAESIGDVDEDFVPVLAFLASKDARFINGQTISIDGGMLMV